MEKSKHMAVETSTKNQGQEAPAEMHDGGAEKVSREEQRTETTSNQASYLSNWRLAVATSSLCLGTLLVAM